MRSATDVSGGCAPAPPSQARRGPTPETASSRLLPNRPRPFGALLPLLALAGCGTWSNEDLRFYEALPTRQDLHLTVPDSAAPVASAPGLAGLLTACGPLGSAETWLSAKPTSDNLNTSIDFMIGLVDAVRRAPPTRRLENGRIWGPFDDDKHAGVEIRIVIVRTDPPDQGGLPEHAFAFEAHRKGSPDPFLPILSGTFLGASASAGSGSLDLLFDNLWALGMQDADTPHGKASIRYDRSIDPRTVGLTLDQPGFALEQFSYGFVGYADGRGRLGYAFRNAQGGRAVVAAGFDQAGAGRADVAFFPAAFPNLSVAYHQCWNSSACLVWSDDVNGYSCGGGSCAGGLESDCPVVPPAP